MVPREGFWSILTTPEGASNLALCSNEPELKEFDLKNRMKLARKRESRAHFYTKSW
jgi:hypothetical protein